MKEPIMSTTIIRDTHEWRQGYTLAEWLYMRDGTIIDPSDMFKQNKPVYERLCMHLGISIDGTKQNLMERLGSYEFSNAQLELLRQFDNPYLKLDMVFR